MLHKKCVGGPVPAFARTVPPRSYGTLGYIPKYEIGPGILHQAATCNDGTYPCHYTPAGSGFSGTSRYMARDL